MDEDAGLTAGEGSSTPLHWAVDSNSVSIVRRLIEYDCDVNAIDETSSVSNTYMYFMPEFDQKLVISTRDHSF